MKTSDFDYVLPERLIATRPAAERDASRLMVLHRAGPAPVSDGGDPPANFSGAPRLEHRLFRDLPDYLRPGDLLVLNDTRVIPARLIGRRAGGGRAEALLIEPVTDPEGQAVAESSAAASRWRAMIKPAKKLPVGSSFELEPPEEESSGQEYGRPQSGGGSKLTPRPRLVIEAELSSGERIVRLESVEPPDATLTRWGLPPLPPYILRARRLGSETHSAAPPELETAAGDSGPATAGRDLLTEDRDRYQTTYARHPGSVAAPTAGLHFTQPLLDRLAAQGVRTARVTLHVGPGTFAPVQADDLESHPMHSEKFRIDSDQAAVIQAAIDDPARRVVAVGTTVTRVLETCMVREGRVIPQNSETDLLIAPGFTFRAIDALVTNFHLPRSTLLALVSAFASRETVLEAYAEAVRRDYRFYSYGDAMLIF